jgi:predicted nucleic acid-binding protein
VSTHRSILVFDDGPLSHFAEAGWLGLLEWVGDCIAWLPETVRRELGMGVDANPHLRSVLEARWLTPRDLKSDREDKAFTFYTSRLLGPSNKNLGECGVLALAEANEVIAVVDDGDARSLADERGVEVKTTVGVLCDLVNDGSLSLSLAEKVADALLVTDYRLPFKPGEFRLFVIQNGLVRDPYDPDPE